MGRTPPHGAPNPRTVYYLALVVVTTLVFTVAYNAGMAIWGGGGARTPCIGSLDPVVLCGHTPRTDAFVAELDDRDREYVLVVADEDAALARYHRAAGADDILSSRQLCSRPRRWWSTTSTSASSVSPRGAGREHLVDEVVRTMTGCTVVAVVRNGEPIAEFDPATFTFAAGNEVVVAGADEAVGRFERRFGD